MKPSRPKDHPVARRADSAGVLSALALLALTGPAAAQAPVDPSPTPTAPAVETGAGPLVLDRITVTARKREEDILDVPLSVTAIDRETLERARIQGNDALARRTPNVFYLDSGVRGFNRFLIRGVGDIGGGFAPDDNSVGYFIDGVPVSLVAIDSDLLDIERVEVLRGPQNGLFGRNAQAGAISVITADPDGGDPERSLAVEGGNLGQRRVTGIAGGALTDRASGRLAVQYVGREGDVPNDIGGDIRGFDTVNLLGTLRADLGQATEARAFVRYDRQDETVLLRTFIEDPDFPRVRLDIEPEQITNNAQAGLTVQHDFGDVRLTSLTGAHYGDFRFLNDQSDGRLFGALTGVPDAAFDEPAVDFADQNNEEFRINQELRFSGTAASVDWIAGGNLFYSNFDQAAFLDITGFFSGTFLSEIETQSYDAFAALSIPVTDRLTLDGEIRYTFENETFDGGFVSAANAPVPVRNQQTQSAQFDFPTWRIAASFAVTEGLNAYASIARGAKAGGFSFFDTDLAQGPDILVDQFDTALTDTYEIGLRGSLWDDRLRFSAAAFFNDTRDEQLSAFDFASFTAQIENADTETYGAELEVTAEPVDGLILHGAIGLLETEITAAAPETGARVGGEVPNAANLTLNLGADYVFSAAPFGLPGDIAVGAEYRHVGERAADIGNDGTLESFDVVNLRARYILDRFELYLFAENVADETYAITAFPFGTSPTGARVSTGSVGQPRLWGGGVKIRF